MVLTPECNSTPALKNTWTLKQVQGDGGLNYLSTYSNNDLL
ncbi:hypothetical protein PCIT_a2943 [Pseudoalteromonas citrea]|uniref:Uncharacterized protein n=1 Tax=Pseudoalteromonas citrea TaxID=43655 RepID=A0AAD4FRP3_9GAMM|nr:hypothetical protein PCIT_a2943 [Pseudoalteromonas citrea]